MARNRSMQRKVATTISLEINTLERLDNVVDHKRMSRSELLREMVHEKLAIWEAEIGLTPDGASSSVDGAVVAAVKTTRRQQ